MFGICEIDNSSLYGCNIRNNIYKLFRWHVIGAQQKGIIVITIFITIKQINRNGLGLFIFYFGFLPSTHCWGDSEHVMLAWVGEPYAVCFRVQNAL